MAHRIAPDDSRLSVTRIEAAAHAIDPAFLHSPQYLCGALSDAIGVQTLLKVETLNPQPMREWLVPQAAGFFT
jgi:threonine dehydratase